MEGKLYTIAQGPLGQVRPFENDDSSDEDDTALSSSTLNVLKGSLEFNKASLTNQVQLTRMTRMMTKIFLE